MILPLYTSMTKIDQSIVEAAQDLGASTTQTLLRVLIPMSVPGISTGITMVFVRRCPLSSSAGCWAAVPTC